MRGLDVRFTNFARFAAKLGTVGAFATGCLAFAAPAIDLTSNTGATINFDGGLTIETTTNGGFNATGGGTVNVPGISNTIVKTSNGSAFNLTSTAAGGSGINFASINVTGGTGTAVNISSSTGTKSLGDVDVARGGGGSGIVASSAGTLNTSAGSINSGNQPAVDIDNTALGMTLTSITSNGATTGLDLNTTTGSFTVTGDGTMTGGVLNRNDSGGTIQNTTNDGVALSGAAGVTLRQMRIQNCGNGSAGDDCIDMNGGSGLTLSALRVENATGTGANLDFGDGLRLTNVTGNNRIDNNSLFTNFPVASTHAVQMRNTNTNGNLTLDGSSFTSQPVSNGATYVTVQSFGSSDIAFTVTNNCQFTGMYGDALLSAAGEQASSTGTVTTVIEDSDFLDAQTNGSGAIAITVSQSGATQSFTIQNNTFRNLSKTTTAPVGIIEANCAGGGGALSGTISDNTIDPNSGTRRGIMVVGQPASPASNVGTVNITIDNNDIDRIPGNFAILTDVDDGIGDTTFTITNNRIGQNSSALGQVGDLDGALLVRMRGTPSTSADVLVQSNTIRANGGGYVAFLDARDTRTSRVRMLSNTLRQDAVTSDPSLYVRTVTGSPSLCVTLDGNNAINNSGANGSGSYEFNELAGTLTYYNAGNNQGSIVTSGSPASIGTPCSLP